MAGLQAHSAVRECRPGMLMPALTPTTGGLKADHPRLMCSHMLTRFTTSLAADVHPCSCILLMVLTC